MGGGGVRGGGDTEGCAGGLCVLGAWGVHGGVHRGSVGRGHGKLHGGGAGGSVHRGHTHVWGARGKMCLKPRARARGCVGGSGCTRSPARTSTRVGAHECARICTDSPLHAAACSWVCAELRVPASLWPCTCVHAALCVCKFPHEASCCTWSGAAPRTDPIRYVQGLGGSGAPALPWPQPGLPSQKSGSPAAE